jgi:hypothetical protein
MEKISSLLNITPTYQTKVPSSGKSVSFRPFLVKEEKILLLAQETNDDMNMIDAIKTIIESCFVDIGDVGNMPLFDVEYLFLQIRSKSVGEKLQPTIVCPITNEEITFDINISDIKIKKQKDNSNKIKIQDDIIVTMSYPSINTTKKSQMIEDEQATYITLANCITSIETKTETIDTTSLSYEEVSDFIDNLTLLQFEKLLDFMLNSPKLEYKAKYTTSDEIEREVILSGLPDFFG